MAGGEIKEAPRADAGVVDRRERHEIDTGQVGNARAQEQGFPNMPVAHDVVDAAPTILETAIPDPNVHRVPVDRLDAGAAAEELAAQHGILCLALSLGTAEDEAVGRVAENEVARLVVSREGWAVGQRRAGVARPVEGEPRNLRIPCIPLEHGAAVGAVPAEKRTRRVLTDDGDALAIGVCLAKRF